MAYALVTNAIAQSANTTSVTTTGVDTTGASLLVAVVSDDQGSAAQTMSDSKSCTWNGLTAQSSASGARVRIYYAINPTVGSAHTFTYGGVPAVFPSLAVTAWSGADTSSPFDVQSGANSAGSTTIQTGSVTPSQANSLVIAALAMVNARTDSIDGSFTISDQAAFNGTTAYGVAHAYLVQTTATAANPTWSWDGSSLGTAAAIAVFKPASGGGGGSSTNLFFRRRR